MLATRTKYTLQYSLFLLGCFLLLSKVAICQTFEINKVVANEDSLRVELQITACNEFGQSIIPFSNKQEDLRKIELSMSQTNGGSTLLIADKVVDITDYSEVDTLNGNGQMKVLFLLDMSGSMKPNGGENKLEKAKEAIREIIMSGNLDGMKVEFATFHNTIRESKSLRKDNFNEVVGRVDIPKGEVHKLHTDLYRAIKDKTVELSTFQGSKVLIVLTDGKDESDKVPIYKYHRTRNPNPLTRIQKNEIISHVKSLDSTFQIFPVGIGAGPEKQFLESIASATKNKLDYFQPEIAPKDLGKSFFRVVCGLKPNVLIRFMPDEYDAIFANEERNFTLNYYPDLNDRTNPFIANRAVVFGTTTSKIDLRPSTAGAGSWPTISVIIYGIIILSLLLVSLIGIVPLMSDIKFKKDFVRKYYQVKKGNVTKKDPLTLQAFNDTDEVVVGKNGEMMLLNTWKYLKDRGEGEISKDFSELFSTHPGGDFFSQKGVYKRLNWLWFGAFGGFIAWLMHLGISNIPLISGDNMFREFLSGIFDRIQDYATPIYNQTFVGLALGIGVVMTLAVVEEYGQSRKFSFGRVLLRVLYGGFMGTLILFSESILTTTILHNQFVGGLIGWTLFGTALGFTVTLFSSIEMLSGLRGGFIAGVVAFLFYYLLGFAADFLSPKMAQMIAFTTYGGILGVIIDSVVSRYEAFELLYLSPKSFAGKKNPISKWLKSPDIDYIYIGKHPDCEIYIKWEDKCARARNARLSYERNMVHVEPEEGEVLVNGTLIRNKTPLNNGDEIQLGMESVSRFRFIAKDKADKGGEYTKGKGGNIITRRPVIQKKKLTVKDKERRGKITINRRNPIK